jgi:hypothetical protein
VEQPGREPRPRLIPFPRPIQAQEHILRKIVHVGPRHPGKQNAMDHASIAIVKSTEGSPITMACRAHKHGIV